MNIQEEIFTIPARRKGDQNRYDQVLTHLYRGEKVGYAVSSTDYADRLIDEIESMISPLAIKKTNRKANTIELSSGGKLYIFSGEGFELFQDMRGLILHRFAFDQESPVDDRETIHYMALSCILGGMS